MAFNVKANNASKARNRLVGILIALCIIVFVCVMTAISSAETKKTITVVRVKPDAPISANSLITEDMVEAYDMYYKEFEQYGTTEFSDGSKRSMIVRWDDRDSMIGQRYAAYYIRGGTCLFWDSTIKDQTRKNSYLYSMTGELLNIQMTTTSEFGDMVVPGDKLNIRATYSEMNYDLSSDEVYKLSENEIQAVEETKTELLFSEVQILDMLNSAGASVFDIYYQYIAATKEQQAMMLSDEGFLASVQPASILLEVTSEEVERFMSMSEKGAQYQMTLLPRTSSSNITESLSDIQEALSGIAGLQEGN